MGINYDIINGPDIVDRIDSLLKEKGSNRQALATYGNFSANNISRWKTLGSIPDIKTGVAIADFLNVPLRWLITGEENCTTDINPKDALLLAMYHSLDNREKKAVFNLLTALAPEE